MKTIYVDMDGVLSDFTTGMKALIDKNPGVELNENCMPPWKIFSQFVSYNQLFKNLPEEKRFRDLVCLLKSVQNDVKISILTSTGDRSGIAHYEYAKDQKQAWLTQRGLFWEFNAVKNKSDKKYYAHKDAMLIDDTLENVQDFIEYGGSGFLYYAPCPQNFQDLETRIREFVSKEEVVS